MQSMQSTSILAEHSTVIETTSLKTHAIISSYHQAQILTSPVSSETPIRATTTISKSTLQTDPLSSPSSSIVPSATLLIKASPSVHLVAVGSESLKNTTLQQPLIGATSMTSYALASTASDDIGISTTIKFGPKETVNQSATVRGSSGVENDHQTTSSTIQATPTRVRPFSSFIQTTHSPITTTPVTIHYFVKTTTATTATNIRIATKEPEFNSTETVEVFKKPTSGMDESVLTIIVVLPVIVLVFIATLVLVRRK